MITIILREILILFQEYIVEIYYVMVMLISLLRVSVRDDRRLYFNDHHNQDDGVTFKRTRCKWGLVWLENSQHQRGVYLHNFTFYSDVSFASFSLPS